MLCTTSLGVTALFSNKFSIFFSTSATDQCNCHPVIDAFMSYLIHFADYGFHVKQ